MKILRRIMCLILCVGISLTMFVSCGKKRNGEDENYQDPNENYSNQMTVGQVLDGVYKNVLSACNTNYADTTCFSMLEVKEENIFDCFVQVQIYMLELLSLNSSISEGKFFYSGASSYSINLGFADKLEMLYILRENEDYNNDIKIYMLFSKSGYGNEYLSTTFLMFYYEIEFNENTNATSLKCFAESSELSALSSDNTSAEYYYLSYVSDGKTLSATKFRRKQDFNYEENTQLYASMIDRFNMVTFHTYTNSVIYPQNNSDMSLTDTNNIFSVKSLLEKFEQVELFVFNLEVNIEISEDDKVYIDGLTDEIILNANAMRSTTDSSQNVVG